MYIIKNKTTQVDEPVGSLKTVSEKTGIKKNSLYEHFSRKKCVWWDDANFRIEKKEGSYYRPKD